MLKRLTHILLAATALLSGCIENDIPLPVKELSITGIEGEGFSVTMIDIATRSVVLTLDETTDIQNVRIDAIHATEGATLSSQPGVYDMRTPLYLTLSLYQDYLWTVSAVQDIPRTFRVDGQIGSATFDLRNRIATANVSTSTDISALAVHELKLEAGGITEYDPALEELSGSDFSSVRFVNVTCHDRTERWTLRVNQIEQNVALTAADAWTRVLWLYGEGIAGERVGFNYRRQGDSGWSTVSSDMGNGITVNGGSFSARIKVEPLTTYEIQAFCGDEQTEIITRTTEEERQLPNHSFEQWSQPKAPWLPYSTAEDGTAVEPFWNTGNNGATVLGDSYNITVPVTDLPPGVGGTYSAQLESRYVVIKLAAGNIFVGEFFGIRSLSHGIVNFGRPFTLRPTAMRLWVKYNRGQITNANDIAAVPAGETLNVGDYDTGSIYIALGTWTKEEYGHGKDNELFGTDECPVSIDTRDVKTFFNPNGKDVVGYGGVLLDESIPEWRQITIPIDYRGVTDRKPTHIIVACSASRWGDYFTGSRDSKMWVDEIELLYD